MKDIAEYTKDQLVLFYTQSIKLEAGRRASFIHDVRSSVWADGKELGKIMETLQSIERAVN